MEDGEAATCLVEIVSERQGADNQADLAVLLGDGSGPYAPTEKMRLTQEGYLGIGTAPSHGLHLYGTSDATGSMLMVERVQNVSTGPAILLRHSRGAAGQDGDHIGYIRFYGYNDAGSPEEILYAGIIGKIQDAEAEAETGAFSFQDIHAGAYDTPVTVAGQQVAVGLAAPLASLHLYTASDYVEARIETGSSDDTRIWLKSGANSWAVNVLEDLSFFDGSTHLLVGDADNDRIGIGTSAPDEALHIVGSVGIRGTSTAAIRLHDTNLSKTWIMQTFPGGFMFSEGMEYAFLSIGQPSSYAWLPGSGDPPSTMIGDSDKGVLYIYHEDSPYSELDLAPLGLTQEEKTEPFIRFVGTSAEEDLTKCLVAGSDVATATNRVYIKLLIGGSETTGYLKAFSLT